MTSRLRAPPLDRCAQDRPLPPLPYRFEEGSWGLDRSPGRRGRPGRPSSCPGWGSLGSGGGSRSTGRRRPPAEDRVREHRPRPAVAARVPQEGVALGLGAVVLEAAGPRLDFGPIDRRDGAAEHRQVVPHHGGLDLQPGLAARDPRLGRPRPSFGRSHISGALASTCPRSSLVRGSNGRARQSSVMPLRSGAPGA